MRRLAVLLVAAVAAGALPVTADAGAARGGKAAAKGKRARIHVKARIARSGARDRGLPAGRRAPGRAAPAPTPATAPGPTPVVTPPPATPAPAPTAAPAPPPALPAPNPRSVSVGATEFAFTLSQPSVHSGEVRVQLDNSRAEDPHDLMVLRGDEPVAHFGEQPAGTVTARKVALEPGTYTLICPLPRHVERGMQAALRVVASGT
jgi:hypothetical protein